MTSDIDAEHFACDTTVEALDHSICLRRVRPGHTMWDFALRVGICGVFGIIDSVRSGLASFLSVTNTIVISTVQNRCRSAAQVLEFPYLCRLCMDSYK
jgi:hypothetical protein